jgi:flagellar motor switch protein FliN
MNAEAAKIVADGMLKGAFDVFDAMLSRNFSTEVEAPAPFSAATISGFPVAFQARIKNNLGAVAMLFTTRDASRFASLIMESGAEPKDSLSPDDMATLNEVAEPALGGGVSNCMERFGRGVEQLEKVEIAQQVDAAVLEQWLGPGGVACAYTFNAPEITGKGVVVFSQSLEKLVPDKLLGGGQGAKLSSEEVSDILSGFETVSAPEVAAPTLAPQNLDMVLDIRLEATARLGRMEMAMGDILGLGPGSIIEVGHAVDEPIELLINDKLIARGDVVVVDEKFGIRITEIVSQRARIESLH